MKLRKALRVLLYHLRYLFCNKVTYRNVVLHLDRSLVSKSIMFRIFNGKYEKNESDIISRALRPNDVVFELGTGMGFISLYCSLICPGRNIYTYEANPLLIPLIKRNFELNQQAINVGNVILSNNPSSDFVDFFVCRNFYSSSLTRPSSFVRILHVNTRDFLTEINRISPTFMIVDIEGFEYELFRGVALPSSIKKVLIELHPEKAYAEFDLVEYFRSNGFSVHSRFLELNQLFAERANE